MNHYSVKIEDKKKEKSTEFICTVKSHILADDIVKSIKKRKTFENCDVNIQEITKEEADKARKR